MSEEAQDRSSGDRRTSGFTAANGGKESSWDSRVQQSGGVSESLQQNAQTAYAPVGVEHHREDWASTKLSPILYKRKRSPSTEQTRKSRTTSKTKSSSDTEGIGSHLVTGSYTTTAPHASIESFAASAPEHTGRHAHQYVGQEVAQDNTQVPDPGQYVEAHDPVWSNQHQHHSTDLNDAQFAEALQREAQLGSHAHTLGSLEASPEQRFPSDTLHHQERQMQGAAAATSGQATPALQKQRKRNFSNRTKTGCLTCRERKKKCDEGKPECNNCHKGGFDCRGYSSQAPVYKTQPPMLQSKNGFVESHVAYGYPPRSASGEFYTESQQVLAAANRHLISETGREVHSRQTPSSQRSNTRSDSSRAWPETSEHSQLQAQHSHYSPEEVYPEISRLPELSREFSSQQKNLFQQAAAMPPPMKRRSYSQPPESYSDQRITAQLALEHASSRQAPSQSSASIPAVLTVTAAAPASDIEKQKMLHSLPYQHFDGLLKKERRLCSVALFQFNEAARYLSLDAAPALFRQIAGHVGERVEVAGHFHCDFAYNLHIENDVEISSGCTILNAGPVSIGARTTIGPNVSIYTYDAIPCNSAHEPGTRRLFVASPVTIGEDCYIAGHVIITRGVTIGKGCTINAKSVVTKDVPSFTTVYA